MCIYEPASITLLTDVFQASSFGPGPVTSDTVGLSWNNPISNMVTAYVVSYTDPCTQAITRLGAINASATTYTVSNLRAGVIYSFQLYSISNITNSSFITLTKSTSAAGIHNTTIYCYSIINCF